MSDVQVLDVQGVAFVDTDGTTAPFAVPPVAGGCIVVGYATFGAPSSTFLPPDDPFGNTYVPLGTGQDTALVGLQLFIATNIATGPTHTVSAHLTGAANVSVVAWALDSADTDNGDWLGQTVGAGASPTVGPTTVSPAAGSLFLAMLGHADSQDFAWPTGWNQDGVNGFATAMQGAGRAVGRTGIFSNNLQTAYLRSDTVETATWAGTLGAVDAVALIVSVAPAPSDPAGTSAGTSTAAAVGVGIQTGVATSAGTSTATAVGLAASPTASVGTSAGTSTAIAVGRRVQLGLGTSAGTSAAIAVGPHALRLNPSVVDDGWGGALTYAWTQVSGPDTATIASPTARETVITFPDATGTYIFQIAVSRADDALASQSLWGVQVFGSDVQIPDATVGDVILTANGVEQRVLIEGLSLSRALPTVTCSWSMFGDRIAVFNDVVLTRNGVRLFGGICLSLGITAWLAQNAADRWFFHPSCVGYAWHLGRARVTKSYTNQSISTIALDLLALAPGGITGEFVAAGLPAVTIGFDDVSIADALTQLTGLQRDLHWAVDDFKRLHLTTMEADGDPQAVEITHPSLRDLSLTLDGRQVVNRVTVTFDRVVMKPVLVDAEIPVDGADGYAPGGGDTTINGNTIHYTGVVTRPSTFYHYTSLSMAITQTSVQDGEYSGLHHYHHVATLVTPYGETNPIWGIGTSGGWTTFGDRNALQIQLTSISNGLMPTISTHQDRTISAINIYKAGSGSQGYKLIGSLSPKGGHLIDAILFEHLEQFPMSVYQTDDAGHALPYPGERVQTFLTGCSGSQDVHTRASVTVDDTAGQAALATAIGSGDTGVVAISIDGGTIGDADAIALAQSVLATSSAVQTSLSCSVEDDRAQPGQSLAVSLPDVDVDVDLKIQQATLQTCVPNVPHRWAITAAAEVVTFDQLLKHATR
jgi:hypothetical protein